MLWQPQGKAAREYLMQKRGFSEAVLRKWEIGFVPGNTWKWWDLNEKVERGWFEDRISFTWRSIDHYCIGFAGRRLDDVEHMKYKTLPGTKRALAIFGLHHPETLEAIKRTGTLVLEEGYTDVIRSHMHACPNVGCLGGTEVTPRQLDLMKSLNLQRLILYMDGDGPGRTATNKIAKQTVGVVPVFQATPPGDKDPGELTNYNDFWNPLIQSKPFIPKE